MKWHIEGPGFLITREFISDYSYTELKGGNIPGSPRDTVVNGHPGLLKFTKGHKNPHDANSPLVYYIYIFRDPSHTKYDYQIFSEEEQEMILKAEWLKVTKAIYG